MPSNVEIKAWLRDLGHVTKRAQELSGSDGTIIRQQDTFFHTPKQGRLKLRDFLNGSGQLIFYERPDMSGPKLSNYSISPTNDPQGLTHLSVMMVSEDEPVPADDDQHVSPDPPEPSEKNHNQTEQKVLSDALGQVGQVKKERHLYMVGQTRVHVDTVEGLGDFMELEVVMRENQSTEEGVAIAHQLMQDLGVKKEDLIDGAYMDLLLEKGHQNGK